MSIAAVRTQQAREPMAPPAIKESELQYFCSIIENLAGISMKPAKHDLIKARLRSRLTETGLKNYREYRDYLENLPREHGEWQAFINLLTTNKTDFFREIKHFEFLVSKLLPEWLKTSEKTLKVWSAASSTGEEAYTMAMVLDRHLPKDRSFKILATDIDTNVLSAAQNSVYPISKKPEIPTEYHQSCLDIGRSNVRGWFRMKRHLREKIIFKQHNLIETTSPGEDVFDLVLCRNVLIYFNQNTIDFVSRKMFSCTKPEGHFFIGHSESLQGISHSWKVVGPSVFRKSKA